MAARKKTSRPKAQATASDELPFSKPIELGEIKSALAGPVRLFFICLGVTIGLMILAALLLPSIAPRASWSWSVNETPLHKNAAFALRPGDALIYEVNASNQQALVRLDAFEQAGCPGVMVADAGTAQAVHRSLAAAQASEPGVYEVCIGTDGNERASDGRVLGSNLSFSNASWPYFQPWMLAVDENFSWPAERIFSVQPVNQTGITRLLYRTVGTANVSGRKAYVVELTAMPEPGGPPWAAVMTGGSSPANDLRNPSITMLIDAQARVLLYAQSGGTSVRLVGAPFINATAP